MKKFVFVSLLLTLLSGCSLTRHAAFEEVNTRDSVRIEVKTVFVKDTVWLEVPSQEASRETSDSTSHLENDFATSDARINPDGSLYHDLKTKPRQIPQEVDVPVVTRDSTTSKTKTATETIIKEVPRELTWFQKTQIYGFWAFLIFLMINYTIRKLKRHIQRIWKK